jgi:hypothetical protein
MPWQFLVCVLVSVVRMLFVAPYGVGTQSDICTPAAAPAGFDRLIERLLLDVRGTELGPMGGDKPARTASVQRVNTVGRMKRSTECGSSTLSIRRLVPNHADHYVYR